MYQKITIVGNLGHDPELKYTAQGDAVTSFSVATNRKWTNSDGQPAEEVTWFRVSVWGKQAEACNQYLAKGRLCLVEGKLTPDKETGGPRIWEGQDGQVRSSFELRAITVQFLGGKGDAPQQATPAPTDAIEEGEVPF